MADIEYVKPKAHIDLRAPHPFQIILDPALEGSRKIDMTPEAFDLVFGKSKKGGGNSFDQGIRITVYPRRKQGDWFQSKYSFTAVADRRGSAPVQQYRDGREGDPYSSSVRVSPSVYDIIQGDIHTVGQLKTLRIALRKKKVSIWSGVRGRSPVRDYNIGWKFAYISALISIPFSLLTMLGEAYHVPDKLRFALESGLETVIGLFKQLTSSL